MRPRLAAFMVAFGLAASACAGNGGLPSTAPLTGPTGSTPSSSEAPATAAPAPTAEPPATVVTSDDGLLTVTIPGGAAAGVDVTITQTDEVPPELAALDIRGKFYELGPDGTRFDVPVTITRIVDPATAGFDLSLGIPAIVLASRSTDGSWEWLSDQAVEFDGSRLVVTATTTHFSTVTAFGGAVLVRLEPPTVTLAVGATFAAGFGVFTGRDVQADLEVKEVTAFETGSVGYVSHGGPLADFPDLVSATAREIHTFSCAQPGKGTYGFHVLVQEDLKGLVIFVDEVSSSVTVTGEAVCLAKVDTTQIGITGAVFCVTHQRFDEHPSYVSGTLALFGPEGTLGGTLVARILGVNGDKPFEVPISAQGDGVFQVGIDAYGPKVFESFTYATPSGATVDLTTQAQDVLGASVEVGPGEGVLAGDGTCPY